MIEWVRNGVSYPTREAVESAVRHAGSNDDRNGQLELMQARIDKLAEIVGVLVSYLEQRPDEGLHWRTIEDDILGYGWEEKQ